VRAKREVAHLALDTPWESADTGSTRVFLFFQDLGEHRVNETLFSSEGGMATNWGSMWRTTPDCVEERESVGIFSLLESRFVHESPDGKMRHNQSVEFLELLSGSHPSLVRACEIPDSPATFTSHPGPSNHLTTSSKQRSTSRSETCMYRVKAMT
jgi:hypothetical protein